MKAFLPISFLAALSLSLSAQNFSLNESGYFNKDGVDIMAFSDFYPEGHQGGITVIMNGKRICANGDIRFEATPGQWQPVPRQLRRDVGKDRIETYLCYPDSSRHDTGFNPMFYPDVQLKYKVCAEPRDKGMLITVELDSPIPAELEGRAGFNLELFPGELFGKPWIMDSQTGIFPRQPNSPLITQESYLDISLGGFRPEGMQESDLDRLKADGYSPLDADRIIAEPYAAGRTFIINPDDRYGKITIRSLGPELKLYDGRMNHNNGWFVLRSELPAGTTGKALQWYIEPETVPEWRYGPVIQTSQLGYHTAQEKTAVIEYDRRSEALTSADIIRIDERGGTVVKKAEVRRWDGDFLRYNYAKVDFSDITEPGLYKIGYGDRFSPLFRISDDIYERGAWQPVIEYFLPVQMCHMRVSEKYRVWHGLCHMDDARMAADGNHIDGYAQAVDNMTHYSPLDNVSGLNAGGWHDAGDFDLRVESQAGECYIMTMAYEAFHPEIDATAIDQKNHSVEIHQPDGRNDILQQIEHGALSVVNGYLALGRLYRGIICNNLRQYVLLGDAAAMTDGVRGNDDDRWVFTEDNPGREMSTAAALAASSRALKGFNDTLSVHCLAIAEEIFGNGADKSLNKVQTAAELYLATGGRDYLDYVLSRWQECTEHIDRSAWFLTRIEKQLEGDRKYRKETASFRAALAGYAENLRRLSSETPYGVPYKPSIWGAGWDIQSFGYRHYFLTKAYPEIFSSDQVFNALNFVLGCHPGINQRSFAGGVGTSSTIVGYGLNRADWSYIPGGVASGTALIRPDFPELLEFPYLWQQVEYCLGGASSHYMFLVLAAMDLLSPSR